MVIVFNWIKCHLCRISMIHVIYSPVWCPSSGFETTKLGHSLWGYVNNGNDAHESLNWLKEMVPNHVLCLQRLTGALPNSVAWWKHSLIKWYGQSSSNTHECYGDLLQVDQVSFVPNLKIPYHVLAGLVLLVAFVVFIWRLILIVHSGDLIVMEMVHMGHYGNYRRRFWTMFNVSND